MLGNVSKRKKGSLILFGLRLHQKNVFKTSFDKNIQVKAWRPHSN